MADCLKYEQIFTQQCLNNNEKNPHKYSKHSFVENDNPNEKFWIFFMHTHSESSWIKRRLLLPSVSLWWIQPTEPYISHERKYVPYWWAACNIRKMFFYSSCVFNLFWFEWYDVIKMRIQYRVEFVVVFYSSTFHTKQSLWMCPISQ